MCFLLMPFYFSKYSDADEVFGITECELSSCISSPCRNGADCIKTDSNNGTNDWYCKCTTGFTGTTCEISVCDNNPCNFGATCVQFPGSGYLCLCPLGKHGHFCEHSKLYIHFMLLKHT